LDHFSCAALLPLFDYSWSAFMTDLAVPYSLTKDTQKVLADVVGQHMGCEV
jgi:hypothetical protein